MQISQKVFTTFFLLTISILSNSQELSTTEPEPEPEPSKTTEKPTEKKNITIAFILPQDFIRFRKFQSCITNQVAKINKGNWSFNKNFYIDR